MGAEGRQRGPNAGGGRCPPGTADDGGGVNSLAKIFYD